MAKDPAFLFYSSDFLTGTMAMSDAEVGQYIRLLCFQHQSGHINAVAMQRLCGGTPTASVLDKFTRDENGDFYNERLEEEVIKRKKHSEKQKENANMRWHKSGIATAMPLENEIAIEKESVVEKKKGGTGEKRKKASQDVIDVVEHLNTRTGRKFDPQRQQTMNLVNSRLKEGFVVDDLKKVVDCKVDKWGDDDKMRPFLRPETLFAPSKFEGYLQEANDPKIAKPQNGHDPRYSHTFVKDKA